MRNQLTPEIRAETLIEALPFLQKFRGQTFVIKYGGSAMDDQQQVDRLLRDIVFLEAVGINPVVVHGGGKAITSRMREAGLTPRFVQGLRVTDAQSIEIVQTTLDDAVNPRIVQTIRDFGGRALGLSGTTVFEAKKIAPQRIEDGTLQDLGFVGEVAKVSARVIRQAIRAEQVPVISPIGADTSGVVFNINADIAAAGLATALRASKLVYISDVPGIMRNPKAPDSLIPTVTAEQVQVLIKEKVIDGGMIPKVQSAVEALKKGVAKIHFINGALPHGLLLEIFTNAGVGTEIVA